MKQLIKILKIEDKVVIDTIKALDEKDPGLIPTIKELATYHENIGKALKDSNNHHILKKHDIQDVVKIALHNYEERSVSIGRHHSSYEKLAEETKKYSGVDFCNVYNGFIFEPKDLDAWKEIKNLIPRERIHLYGKNIDNGGIVVVQQMPDVGPVSDKDSAYIGAALDTQAKLLGREVTMTEGPMRKGDPKIKKMIVNNEHGLHARPAAQFVEACKKYPGEINMIYKEDCVDPKSILSIMMHAVESGSEILLEFYGGKDYRPVYKEIAEIIRCPIFKDKYRTYPA